MKPHEQYIDTERWMKRSQGVAAKMLARHLAGKTSARAWVKAELRAQNAKREHWRAETALARDIRKEATT